MPSDGNCLFRALSHRDGLDHHDVRLAIVDHMKEHWDDTYRAFVSEDDESDGGYLANMATDGVWGDELVLQAYSDMMGRCVEVYAASHPYERISRYGRDRSGIATQRLVFDGGHYDVLMHSGRRKLPYPPSRSTALV